MLVERTMPGRGLLTVACLVLIALSCLSAVRKLEAERRVLRRLRSQGALAPESSLSVQELPENDRDCLRSLESAGVVALGNGRCYLRVGSLPPFRRKRVRLALSGGLIALLLAVVVATTVLR